MPKVSVIIPTADRPELLERAIRSVFLQTFTDFEIIVIDDGVQIPAESVVRSCGDNRVSYIKNLERKGGAGSRNTGVRVAKGEFVAFLDDDDQWVPDKLALQVSLLAHASHDVVFSFTGVKNVYDDHEEVTDVPDGEANFLERALTRFSGFLTSTLLIKKTIFAAVGGFDESLPSHQEPDLIIRLSKKYDGVGVNEPLTVMSLSRTYEHISSHLSRRIAGREALLEKHRDLFSKRPKILAKHYFRIGLWNRDSGKPEEARKYFLMALRTSFSLRHLFHYLRMCLR